MAKFYFSEEEETNIDETVENVDIHEVSKKEVFLEIEEDMGKEKKEKQIPEEDLKIKYFWIRTL